MSADYDKEQWQAEQAARDSALDKQREKEAKTRERSARNARRKLERLRRTLTEKGEITEFENEFGQSVVERLDKFGSAFHDLEKGRPGDALSFAQKRVMAAMNKKVKDLKKKPAETDDNPDADYERTADRWKNKSKSSFKQKGFKSKKGYTPRVRHIEDGIVEPNWPPKREKLNVSTPIAAPKKPFLRLVKNDVSETEEFQERAKLSKFS